jgi:hypothetical protein
MVGRHGEDTPQVDYMRRMQDVLKNNANILSTSVGPSEKKGAASADLRTPGYLGITIDHAGKRLTVALKPGVDIEKTAVQVKTAWRAIRGAPTLNDKRNKTV